MKREEKIAIGVIAGAIIFLVALYYGYDYLFVTVEKPQTPKSLATVPESEIGEAFNSTTPKNELPAGIVSLFQSFTPECEKMLFNKLTEQFDMMQLYSVATTYDLKPAKPLSGNLGNEIVNFYPALLHLFSKHGFGLPWNYVQIVKVVEHAKDRAYRVYVRQSNGDEVAFVRYDISKNKDLYKIYDIEDLRFRNKLSLQFAISVGTSIEENEIRMEWQKRLTAMSNAGLEINKGEYRFVNSTLAASLRNDWPSQLKEVAVSIDEYATLNHSINSKKPFQSDKAFLSDLHDLITKKDVEAASRIEAKFGPTPHTINTKIHALFAEKRFPEAYAAYAKGFDFYPESPTILAWNGLFD